MYDQTSVLCTLLTKRHLKESPGTPDIMSPNTNRSPLPFHSHSLAKLCLWWVSYLGQRDASVFLCDYWVLLTSQIHFPQTWHGSSWPTSLRLASGSFSSLFHPVALSSPGPRQQPSPDLASDCTNFLLHRAIYSLRRKLSVYQIGWMQGTVQLARGSTQRKLFHTRTPQAVASNSHLAPTLPTHLQPSLEATVMVTTL